MSFIIPYSSNSLKKKKKKYFQASVFLQITVIIVTISPGALMYKALFLIQSLISQLWSEIGVKDL